MKSRIRFIHEIFDWAQKNRNLTSSVYTYLEISLFENFKVFQQKVISRAYDLYDTISIRSKSRQVK